MRKFRTFECYHLYCVYSKIALLVSVMVFLIQGVAITVTLALPKHMDAPNLPHVQTTETTKPTPTHRKDWAGGVMVESTYT
jgi:hypothetical protein